MISTTEITKPRIDVKLRRKNGFSPCAFNNKKECKYQKKRKSGVDSVFRGEQYYCLFYPENRRDILPCAKD